ncbi:unnamed protein product [Spodoptera exigua]|nr:unnamed protein product [Spodoptera exigua]
MAKTIQIFLPLVYFVINAQGDYLDAIAGLRHLSQPHADQRNEDFNSAFKDWFHHFDSFPTSVNGRRPYVGFDAYFNRDPYYSSGGWDQMPQINNVFNIPSGTHNSHSHPGHKESKPEQTPKPEHVDDVLNVQEPTMKPDEILPTDKPIDQDPINKIEEVIKADIKNQSEILPPPKTNKINENDDMSDKDDKSVELNEKKDYLLVGQGNNGKDVYLLHENPAPVALPNNNQPANNVMYVQSPGPASTNQVYQILNGPTPVANLQLSPDKLGVNNDVPNSIPPTTNVSPASQLNNVVSVYSNGQIIQIPGVVVVPNNLPVDVGNQPQRPNYVVANVPNNNVQSSNQNPGQNIYYAAVPNQGSNNPIYYLQVPNQGVNNAGNVMLNNGLPGNIVAYQVSPNVVTQPAVSNGYVQSNIPNNQGMIAVTIPNQGIVLDNANNQYQLVVVPQGTPSNVYNQPNQPNQGLNPVVMLNGQSLPVQTVQVQNGNNGNTYNQPMLKSERQEVTPSNQGYINNQNLGIQPAVLMPSNGGYYQPPITNQMQVQNVPSQGIETPTSGGSYIQPAVLYDVSNNQNVPPQPIVSVNDAQVPIQGNQVTNSIPNIPPVNTADVVAPPEENAPLAIATSPLILDGGNMESLGVQPAVMLTGFKDSEDGKNEKKTKEDRKDKKDKKDKKEGKEGKERKERKEKSKKKSKKDKDEKSGEVFTN